MEASKKNFWLKEGILIIIMIIFAGVYCLGFRLSRRPHWSPEVPGSRTAFCLAQGQGFKLNRSCSALLSTSNAQGFNDSRAQAILAQAEPHKVSRTQGLKPFWLKLNRSISSMSQHCKTAGTFLVAQVKMRLALLCLQILELVFKCCLPRRASIAAAHPLHSISS